MICSSYCVKNNRKIVEVRTMKTRVYYGEYTLRHWLNLMLTRNIDLPDYQRSFVWGENDVKRMMESLEFGQFVPPVTIAHFNDGNESKNLILDGQQRLTSLLLAYLGRMPIKEKFVSTDVDLAAGDDSDEDGQIVSSMEWTYKFMLSKNPNEDSLAKMENRIREDERYAKLDIALHHKIEDFYDDTFLGFSFVIPDSEDAAETQRYFSTLFRNMNYLGHKLSPLESRRSLYYLNADYKNFFDGKLENGEDVLCGIRLIENMQARKLDFVRYLSTLSQYKGTNDIKKVLRGYSAYSSRESYYADYVSYIVGLEQEDRNDKFDNFKIKELFPNQEWRERFVTVKSFLEKNKARLGLDEKSDAFKSWIDADYWLYGLLYFVVFEGSHIAKEEELISAISSEVLEKKNTKANKEAEEYSKNPNRVGNLRDRILRSIDIYENHAE